MQYGSDKSITVEVRYMNQDFIRLGIIGIGNMGSEHCRNIAAGKCPEIRITAGADLREDRRTWFRENIPEPVEVYESGEDLIHSSDCDAVLICVPHYGHEELAVSAMENGKHVLCEKPAAVTARAARHMCEVSGKTGKTLTFMFNQRTNCLYRGIHDVLSSGEFGKIKRMNWIVTDWYRTQKYYDSGSWRATWAGEGGGVLLNQCPHQLDLLIWLCGMPVSVTAVCHEGKWHHIEVEDDVSVYLEFPGGATGTFIASTGELPGTNRLEIDCEMGKIVCEDGITKCWKLPQNERDICYGSDNPWFSIDPAAYVLRTDGQNPQHIGVLNAFAAHLLRGDPLIAEKEDGLRETILSNAIYLSGWTGKPVALPADESEYEQRLKEKTAGSAVKTGDDITYNTNHTGTGKKDS